MQYTLRNIPRRLDQALRRKAKAEGVSLNEIALTVLAQGLDVEAEPVVYRDLENIAGSWIGDPETERTLAEQDQIDPEMWK